MTRATLAFLFLLLAYMVVGQIDLEAVPVLEAWTVRSEADTGAEEAHATRYARMTSLEQEVCK